MLDLEEFCSQKRMEVLVNSPWNKNEHVTQKFHVLLIALLVLGLIGLSALNLVVLDLGKEHEQLLQLPSVEVLLAQQLRKLKLAKSDHVYLTVSWVTGPHSLLVTQVALEENKHEHDQSYNDL